MAENILNEEKSEINLNDTSQAERKLTYEGYEESKLTNKTFTQSMKDSLKQVNQYYEQSSRILTKNFAGAEDIEEIDEIKRSTRESLTDKRKISMNMSMSRYEYQNQKGELSFWGTLFTFIKVNIVAGFLFLPNGYKNGGYLFSIIAVFFVTVYCAYCNISISECTDAASSYSFSKIGYKAGGKLGFYCVEIGIAICQVCFPCSYANLITQIVNNMLNLWFGNKENYFLYIGICLAIILIPLCLIRNISKLSSLHFIGDLAVLATVISLTYESIKLISTDPDFNLDDIKMFNSGWAKLLGMSITALEGIGVILPIKESMKDKSKFNWVIILGTFSVGIILMTFPLIMYLCYQDNVNEIVLNNLPLDKLYIQIILLLMVFSVIIVYPVVLYPSFQIFSRICCGSADPLKAVGEKKNSLNKIDHSSSESSTQERLSWRRLLLENSMRIFIVSGTIIVGVLSINRFDTMISLVGCGICTPIAFIFPSIFHYILFKDKQSRFRNILDIFATILGITISIVVLIFTLIN